MIVTKSDIESIIEEELKAYLKEASLPRGAIELPGDKTYYYILSPDKKSYDAYKREGNKLARKGVTDAESLGRVLKAAGEEEEGPGILQSIYNYIFGQEGIQYYKGLPENLKTAEEDIKAGKESIVLWCKQDHCAQWVSDTLGTAPGSTGHAWHQHQLSRVRYSAFANINKALAYEAADLFARIRRGRASNSQVKNYVKQLIPDQSTAARALRLGDIVGLYYENSTSFKTAFTQGATGLRPDKKGELKKVADGPFFVQKGGKWVPGNTLLSGRGFGMNTHLGFVGAMYNGEPVIFHNVKGAVKAAPLDHIKGKSSIKIMWNKPAQLKLSEEKGSMAQRPTKADIAASKINDTNLPDNIKNAVLAVALSQESIMKSLGIDKQTLRLLTNAAVGVTGRESGFAKGKRYNVLKWAENMASVASNNPIAGSLAAQSGLIGWALLSLGDTSIGPAQMRFGAHFGDKDAELADYAQETGIRGPMSVTNYSKSIIAAIGILSLLYKKAIDLGYSTDSPGVSREKFVSTGNAALDMSFIGYNTKPENVTNYCGAGSIKKRCEEAEQEPVAQNYIPLFKQTTRSGTLTSLGYVSEVAQNMKKYKEIHRLF